MKRLFGFFDFITELNDISEGEDKKDWIKDAIKRPGAFREKAEKEGLTVKQFIKKVITNKEKYDSRTLKQAYLAKTLIKMSKNRKKKKTQE